MTAVTRSSALAARPLPLALVVARVVELAKAPLPREPPVTRRPAPRAADHLRRASRRRGHKPLPALAASTTHPPSVPRAARQSGAALSRGGGVDQYRAAADRRSRGAVDHDPAARWLRLRAPLKRWPIPRGSTTGAAAVRTSLAAISPRS